MTMNEKIEFSVPHKKGCVLTSKGVVIAYEDGKCRIMSFNRERFHSIGSRVILPESASAETIKAVIERLTEKH